MFFNSGTNIFSSNYSGDLDKRDSTFFSLSQNSSTGSPDAPSSGSKRPSLATSRIAGNTVKAGSQPVRGRTALEPPCRPVTVSLVEKAIRDGLPSVYGAAEDAGPVSLLGWPVQGDAPTFFGPGEIQFHLCDGTGVARIQMAIDSENEQWLLKKLEHLIRGSLEDKENTSDFSATCYLRVVGALRSDNELPVTLRCIHARQAEPQEIAFYHTLDVAWTLLKATTKGSENSGHASSVLEENTVVSASAQPPSQRRLYLETVELPETFSVCRDDRFQHLILQYIMKNREKTRGVSCDMLEKDLADLADARQIQKTLEELMDMAFCMKTLDGYVDIVIDENDD